MKTYKFYYISNADVYFSVELHRRQVLPFGCRANWPVVRATKAYEVR
jgi:hypothetical protein